MKKKSILLVFSITAFNLGFSQGYTGDSWAQAKEKGEGEITLAYVESPGMVYKDNSGKLTGICVDIMADFIKYVNQKKNVKLTTKFMGDGQSFKVMYDNVPIEALQEFRRLSGTQAQSLLERLDKWLSQHDRDTSETNGTGQIRTGIGIYYFEEDMESQKPKGSRS